jgi:hypothetical protein
MDNGRMVGLVSLWTAIGGVVGGLALGIAGLALPGAPHRILLLAAVLVALAAEVVALVTGISARATRAGRAGMVISIIALLLIVAAVTFLVPVTVIVTPA